MLNKLHVQKNNFAHLSELPVMGDHVINDLSCSLYKEELDSQTNGIKFVKDYRHQIQFKEPFKKKGHNMVKES